jgi:hypothetical protein
MLLPRLFKKRGIWSVVPYQLLLMGDLVLLLYYLAIYFQSVRGANPVMSGVYNLPIVVAVGIFCVVGGVVVSKTGHATATMLVGAAVGTIGCGLLCMLDEDTSTGKWIGYQLLAGAGMAFSVQNGMNIAQANVDNADLAAMVANVYCKCTQSTNAGISQAYKTCSLPNCRWSIRDISSASRFCEPTSSKAAILCTRRRPSTGYQYRIHAVARGIYRRATSWDYPGVRSWPQGRLGCCNRRCPPRCALDRCNPLDKAAYPYPTG